MYIDTHVHCRDEDQSYKETIAHALSVAKRAGFTLIMDIGNLARPVSTREDALRRMDIALRAESEVIYGTYLILTRDPRQIREAVKACDEFRYEPGCKVFVSGLKMFGAQSTGDSGIVSVRDQFDVCRCLADEGYDGVLLFHGEKESDFVNGLWDPADPITHARARPAVSEVNSVQDIVYSCSRAGFNGRLHIAHASVPKTLDIVKMAYTLGVRIAAEITPHHCLFDMSVMSGPDGLQYKMNPPLRSREMADGLHPFLADEHVDYVWIASDHAPHTLDDKIDPDMPKPYASGIPGMYFIPRFVQILKSRGMSWKRIEYLTFNNAAKAFGLTGLKPRKVEVLEETLKSISAEYPFDPYRDYWS